MMTDAVKRCCYTRDVAVEMHNSMSLERFVYVCLWCMCGVCVVCGVSVNMPSGVDGRVTLRVMYIRVIKV